MWQNELLFLPQLWVRVHMYVGICTRGSTKAKSFPCSAKLLCSLIVTCCEPSVQLAKNKQNHRHERKRIRQVFQRSRSSLYLAWVRTGKALFSLQSSSAPPTRSPGHKFLLSPCSALGCLAHTTLPCPGGTSTVGWGTDLTYFQIFWNCFHRQKWAWGRWAPL